LSEAETLAAAATPAARRFVRLLAAALAAIALLWASDGHVLIGLRALYAEQMAAAALGLATALCFLVYRQRRGDKRPGVPVADRILAALALGAGFYLALRYPVLSAELFYRPVEALVLAAALFLAVFEALRRSTGWSLNLILAAFFAYALVAHLMPALVQGKKVAADDLLVYMTLDATGMMGASLLIAVQIVLPFVLLGALLQATGGSEFFTDIAAAALGRTRGGPAKIAVLASSLFGTTSGSAVANVYAVGVVTIPLMKRGGYSPRMAGAIEAVASTGGQIMPPVMGAAAFLMAEFLKQPYAEIALAALVPALLYYFAIFAYVDLEAVRRGIRPVEGASVPRARAVLAQGWHFVVPFAVLMALLFVWSWRAEKAALAAAAVLAALGLVRRYGGRRLTARGLVEAIVETGRGSVEIIVICALSGMIIAVLARSSLDFTLTLALVEFGKSSLVLLLLATAVVGLVLGLGLPTTAVYLLLAALAAKPLETLGIHPLAAHMFIFYFGMLSMITPPVAMAAFAGANLAGAGPMETGWLAMRLAWPSYIVPFLFVLSPTLLLQGSWWQVALDCATAALGVYATTAGIAGALLRPLGAAERLILVPAGLALMLPAQAFAAAPWAVGAGAAAGLAVIARHCAGSLFRRDVPAPPRRAPWTSRGGALM
jgi:TRAP transporter 4TM/12TM fusion protein